MAKEKEKNKNHVNMVDFKGKLEVMPVNMNIQEQDQGEKGHAIIS